VEHSTVPPGYVIKGLETVAKGSDLQARLYTLAPGEVIPWHFHTHVTDWYFCLAGLLRIETRSPHGDERLTVGQHRAVPSTTGHRISNAGENHDCRFLLLQGVGTYDFNKLPD
jgi:mannose-6-phosphate isomerase-like protein (cupin superfamily)